MVAVLEKLSSNARYVSQIGQVFLLKCSMKILQRVNKYLIISLITHTYYLTTFDDKLKTSCAFSNLTSFAVS